MFKVLNRFRVRRLTAKRQSVDVPPAVVTSFEPATDCPFPAGSHGFAQSLHRVAKVAAEFVAADVDVDEAFAIGVFAAPNLPRRSFPSP